MQHSSSEKYNIENQISPQMDIMSIYYSINFFWIWFNLLVIAPFVIACVCRLRNPQMSKILWSDHLARLGLLSTLIFYLVDTAVKVHVDGMQSICQKSTIIHHIASLFIMGPLILNSYIPWWVNPVGFVHGYIVFFDDHIQVQYFYGLVLVFFQYMLYQKPYRDLKYYWVTRIAINYVWTFIVMFKLGECSNFLPTEREKDFQLEEGVLY